MLYDVGENSWPFITKRRGLLLAGSFYNAKHHWLLLALLLQTVLLLATFVVVDAILTKVQHCFVTMQWNFLLANVYNVDYK